MENMRSKRLLSSRVQKAVRYNCLFFMSCSYHWNFKVDAVHEKANLKRRMLFCSPVGSSAAPRGPKLITIPSRAQVGDTVRIAVQGFQLGSPVS